MESKEYLSRNVTHRPPAILCAAGLEKFPYFVEQEPITTLGNGFVGEHQHIYDIELEGNEISDFNINDSQTYCDVDSKHRMEVNAQDLFNISSILTFDLPKEHQLPKESKLCGYIEKNGTYHKCDHCQHEQIIRQLVWDNKDFRDFYLRTKSDDYINKPRGMFQEEYFAMKFLGFVKISSFKDAPNQMVVFRYNDLTPEQSAIIYPV